MTRTPGRRTTLLGVEGLPESDLSFAGEHTRPSSGNLDSMVASGDRAADRVKASLAA